MPLIRVTPETAASTAEDLARVLCETVAGAGAGPGLEKIQRDAESLRAMIAQRRLEVEVLVVDSGPEPWAVAAAGFLGIPREALRQDGPGVDPVSGSLEGRVSVVGVRFGMGVKGRRAGARRVPVQVVVRGVAEAPPDERMQELLVEIRERPLTIVLVPPGADWARALTALGSRNSWECRMVAIDARGADRSIDALLAQPGWSQALELACAWSGVEALASLYKGFAVVLESEQRALGAKRAVVEQQATTQGSSANPTEVIGEVRGLVQKRFDGFQKTFSAGLEKLIDPHDGALAVEVEGVIAGLDELDVEKKPKIDVVTVPDAVLQQLLGRTTEELQKLLRSETVRLDALLEETEKKVEEIIEVRGGPPTAINIPRLSREALGTSLERSVVLQRGYRGEITRRGPMDFFMAARRYQMIFFMVASAFGLSFIRSYREFTIPVGVLLLSYGLLSVVHSARRQRAEADEKELTKARDNLASDMQRAMNDVRRSWEQIIAGHLSEQQGAVLEKVDGSMKVYAEEANRQADQQRKLVQQQLKSLDNTKRKLVEGSKKAEAADEDLAQLTDQLEAFYAASTAPLGGLAEDSTGGGKVEEDARLPTGAAVALEKMKGEADVGAAAAEKLDRLRQGGFTQAFQTARDKRMEGKESAGSGKGSPRRSVGAPQRTPASPQTPSRRPASPAKEEGGGESPADRLQRLKAEVEAARAPGPAQPAPPSAPLAGAEREVAPAPAAADQIVEQASREAEKMKAQAAKRLAELQQQAPAAGPASPAPKEEPPKPGRLDQLKGGGGLTQAFSSLKKRKKKDEGGGAGSAGGRAGAADGDREPRS